MIEKFSNHLILKNNETSEEHIARIVSVEKKEKKIKLELVDEKKNIYYRRNREVNVLIPVKDDLYSFSTPILFFDILERVMTIEYPKAVLIRRRRTHKRLPLRVAIKVEMADTIFDSLTYDISLGGISFVTVSDKVCVIDDIVKVFLEVDSIKSKEYWIHISNKRPIELNGKNYTLYGGNFEDLSQEGLEELAFFLNKNDVKMQ